LQLPEHDRLTDTVEIIFYELPKLEQLIKDAINGDKPAIISIIIA